MRWYSSSHTTLMLHLYYQTDAAARRIAGN
jgi:hypothetical protein